MRLTVVLQNPNLEEKLTWTTTEFTTLARSQVVSLSTALHHPFLNNDKQTDNKEVFMALLLSKSILVLSFAIPCTPLFSTALALDSRPPDPIELNNSGVTLAEAGKDKEAIEVFNYIQLSNSSAPRFRKCPL